MLVESIRYKNRVSWIWRELIKLTRKWKPRYVSPRYAGTRCNFKIRIKSYLSKRKNFYFSSEIWGHLAFTFCRYFHQNLQVLPSESVAGNALRFRGKFPYTFQTKFFTLEFEGISYNSVVFYWIVLFFFNQTLV